MKRLLSLVVLTAVMAGCATERPTRSYIQANALDKETFKGTWYYLPTVIDVPAEASFTFVGEQGYTEKIRWSIQEKYLLAYRSYELIDGADAQRPSNPDTYLGQPVAAFKIESHFDIFRQYNPTTGEEINVLEENTKDRLWYERRFMRVDWSQNMITNFNFTSVNIYADIFGELKREPAAFYEQQPNSLNSPLVTENYIDVVTQEIVTPTFPDLYLPEFMCFGDTFDTCMFTAHRVTYRHSFKKAPPVSDYQALDFPDPLFEKFGYFRTEREGYNHARGITDLSRVYRIQRWNIWEENYEKETLPDGTVKLRTDSEGKPIPIPMAQRRVKPIVYYTNHSHRPELLDTTKQTVAGWNKAFKMTVSSLQGLPMDQVPEVFVLKENSDGYYASKEACESKHGANVCHQLDGKWCSRVGDAATDCRLIGDLRYNFAYLIESAGLGTPLGYGPSAADPETGQIIQANAFVYAAALDLYKTTAMDMIDLIEGNVSEDEFANGEWVRQYFQDLGQGRPPQLPQIDPFFPTNLQLNGVVRRLERLRPKLQALKQLGRSSVHVLRNRLKGTAIEDMLMHNELFYALGTVNAKPGDPVSEKLRELISPLRGLSPTEVARRGRLRDQIFGKRSILTAGSFVDAAVSRLVEKFNEQFSGVDAAEKKRLVGAEVLKRIYRGVMEHEIGHTVGLRHNFEGSFDEDNFGTLNVAPGATSNFGNDYWEIVRANPGDPDADPAVKAARDRAGAREYQYSSIMDYGGNFYTDNRGIGRYDVAAIKFGYGMLVERFTDASGAKGRIGRPVGAPDPGFTGGFANADRSNRYDVSYYLGGERCQSNSDCPHASLGQTCQTPFGFTAKLCTSYDEDVTLEDRGNGVNGPNVLKFMFCSDERADDRPFCNRWDEGVSSQAIVQNMIDTYHRNYIFNAFRRYRRSFGYFGYISRIFDRYFRIVGDQFQSWIYKYYYEPEFAFNEGRGGFTDMYLASVKGMNFIASIVAQPDEGYFRWDNNLNVFRNLDYEEAPLSGDFQLPPPVGKAYYTRFENGYFGQIERYSVIGTFIDKLFAMATLTTRDWGRPNFNDETFLINFYDLFQKEMLDLFGAVIADQFDKFGPLVTFDGQNQPTLTYRNWHYYDFLSSSAPRDPVAEYNGQPTVQAAGGLYNQLFALTFSVLDFNLFFDTSYNDYMTLWIEGEPAGFSPPAGAEVTDYTSPFTGKKYMAVQTYDKKSVVARMVDLAKAKGQLYRDTETLITNCTSPTNCDGTGKSLERLQDDLSSMRYDLLSMENMMNQTRLINKELFFDF